MSSASYFTSAFKPLPRTDDHRSSKKRKRNGGSSEDKSSSSEVEAAPSSRKRVSSVRGSITSGFSSIAVPATVRRETAVQYQAAGQSFDTELPGLKFPHAPPHLSTGSVLLDTKLIVEKELATLKPPLILTKLPPLKQSTAWGKVETFGLRRKHLDNIIAILHKSVLEGEFLRAGRAWGMLLRAEQSGHGMDIRHHDRWGLGAEILLKHDHYSSEEKPGESRISGLAENPTGDQATRYTGQCFSRKGFRNAKDYYERLILQYPYRKAFPTATSALDFYPVMFGLWLCVVQDQYKTAIMSVGKSAINIVRDNSKISFEESASLSPLLDPPKHQRMAGIRDDTLQHAEEIASRLNELIVSPPYSDDSRLWRLQGMVALWIADLWVVPLPSQADVEVSEGATSPTPISEARRVSGEYLEAIVERERCLANRQVAISKAKQAFSNATEKGADGGATM